MTGKVPKADTSNGAKVIIKAFHGKPFQHSADLVGKKKKNTLLPYAKSLKRASGSSVNTLVSR